MQTLGKDILIIIFASIFVLLITSFIIVFIVLYQKRQQKYAKEKEEMKVTFQQELLKTQLEIQEATLKNISQEIHDNIGQALSFIKLNINTIDITATEKAKEKLFESKKLLTKAIQDLRDISKSLNTDFISEIGLVNALEQQLTLLKKTGLYSTSSNVTGQVEKFELQKELFVFRIVQELLNNIVKHAEATSIDIYMNYLPSKLSIDILDNGKGFDPSIIENVNSQPKGIGLYNMLNRIALVNGKIQFNTQPGKGTMVNIELIK